MDESPEAHGHPYTAAGPLQMEPHICKFSDEICTTTSHGLVLLSTWFSAFNFDKSKRRTTLYYLIVYVNGWKFKSKNELCTDMFNKFK